MASSAFLGMAYICPRGLHDTQEAWNAAAAEYVVSGVGHSGNVQYIDAAVDRVFT